MPQRRAHNVYFQPWGVGERPAWRRAVLDAPSYVYDWADVPEPTEADLAEVDAALAATEPVEPTHESMQLWAMDAKVKLAMTVVGPPDGPEWLARFSSILFGITEAVEKLGIDELLLAGQVWQRFTDDANFEKGSPKAAAIIHKFLAAGLTIPSTADYLGTTAEKVCTVLSKVGDMATADALLRSGTVPVGEVARRTGVPRWTLIKHTQRCGIETQSQRLRGQQVNPDVKARGLALHAEGMGTTEIAALLTTEFGFDISKHRVHKWVVRAA